MTCNTATSNKRRGPIRPLLAASLLIAAAQLAVVIVAAYPYSSGLGQLGGWLIAAGVISLLLVAALICLLVSWLRRKRLTSQRWLRGVTLAALLLPLLNLVYFTWLPSAARLGAAASNGDVSVVARCLFWGVDADATHTEVAGFGGRGKSRPPLERAARGGHLDVVTLLLDAGAEINLNQSAALRGALEGGRADVVGYLLDHGAALERVVDTVPYSGFGTDEDQRAALRQLLQKRPDAVAGSGMLVMVAYHGELETAREVAAVDVGGRYGPVYELLRNLVLDQPTKSAYRAAAPMFADLDDAAVRLQTLEDVHYSRDYRALEAGQIAGELMLNLAVKFDDPALVAALLADGVPAEPPPDDRRQLLTPLHRAIYFDRLTLVQTLINAGADLDRPNRTFGRALHLAVRSGSLAMLELLLQAGAPLESPENKAGSGTALYHAVYFDDLERTRMLVQAGADPHARGWSGDTSCEQARNKRVVRRFMSLVCEGGDFPRRAIRGSTETGSDV